MAFIEYLLDNFKDSNEFESLCSEIMLKEGYSKINPVGGTGDKGRDAEEEIYNGTEGKRTILFQFSLQKTIRAKVNKTLRRIHDSGLSASEVIFIFSTEAKTGERDRLKENALNEYGLNINILGQRYLAIRLASKEYADVAERFFAGDITKMKTLYDSGQLFAPDSVVPDKEKRCLINLMHYGRHPLAGNIKDQIIREAVRRVLTRCVDKFVTLKEIAKWYMTISQLLRMPLWVQLVNKYNH
jgi:hypothetical protein